MHGTSQAPHARHAAQQGRPKRWTAWLAGVLAFALTITIAPAAAQAAPTGLAAEHRSTVRETSDPVLRVPDRVPAVDSLLGRGSKLSTHDTRLIRLADRDAEEQSALVRVTVVDPATSTTVYTGQSADSKTAMLYARAGRTTSTTVLLPMVDGRVSLWGDRSANYRLEALAFLTGDVAEVQQHDGVSKMPVLDSIAPGSTVALETPVLRADTEAGLGGARLDAAGTWIGLLGEGGVDPEHVRGIYASLDVTLSAADTVVLGDGQRLPLPRGRSVVTTLINPDETGGISMKMAGTATASLRLAVTGWVVEAPEDTASANATGSWVAATSGLHATTTDLQGGSAPTAATLSDQSDVTWATLLVSGTALRSSSAGGGAGASSLAWTKAGDGRSQDVMIDAMGGAQPQLALVPVSKKQGYVSLRGGAAGDAGATGAAASTSRVSIQSLGGFLGEPTAGDAGTGQPAVHITSPQAGANVDLTERGTFRFEGSVTLGSSMVDRIEIASPQVDGSGGLNATNDFIGTAALDFQGGKLTWFFDTQAPASGTYEYVALMYTRNNPGSVASQATVRVNIDAATASDEVVSSEAVVAGAPASGAPGGGLLSSVGQLSAIDQDTATFASRPKVALGTILVSAATEAAPEGFLGRISSINREGGRWVVETSTVSFEELTFQADKQYQKSIDEADLADTDVLEFDESDQAADGKQFEVSTAEPAVDGTWEDPEIVPEVEEDRGPAGGGPELSLVTGTDVDLDLDAAELGQDPEDVTVSCGGTTTASSGEVIPGARNDCGGTPDGLLGAEAEAPAWVQSLQGRKAAVAPSITGELMAGYVKEGSSPGQFKVWNTKTWSGAKKKEEQEKASSALSTETKLFVGGKAKAELGLYFDITFDVRLKLAWKLRDTVDIRNFSIILSTHQKATLDLWVAGQFSVGTSANDMIGKLLKSEQEVGEIAFAPITFFVGPVPVVFTHGISFNVGIDFTVEGKWTFPTIGFDRYTQSGFRYTSATGFTGVNDTYEKKMLPKSMYDGVATSKIELKAELAAGVSAAYNLRIYGFAGPSFELGGKLGIEGKLTIDLGGGSSSYYQPIAYGSLEPFFEVYGKVFVELQIFKISIFKVNLIELTFRHNFVTITFGAPQFGDGTTMPQVTAVGKNYSGEIEITGGPKPDVVWGDHLPPGLVLDEEEGTVVGKPTEGGEYSLQVQAGKTHVGYILDKTFKILVLEEPFANPSTTVKHAPGSALSYAPFSILGTPALGSLNLTSGSLPPGLHLDGTTVVGTPAKAGIYTATFGSTWRPGVAGYADKDVSTTVRFVIGTAPVFTNPSPETIAGEIGAPVDIRMRATRDLPTTFTATSALPPGLSLSTGGHLTGTAPSSGTYPFTVQATNEIGTTSHSYSFVSGTVPVFETTELPPAEQGVPYSFQVEANGDPDPEFQTSDALPSGLSLDVTGLIDGTSTGLETKNVEIEAHNDVGSAKRTFELISGTKPTINPSFASPATTGVAYSGSLDPQGNPAPVVTLTAGAIPHGMTLNAATGELSGTPDHVGSFTFELTATNALGSVARETTIEVHSVPVFDETTLPKATVDQAYEATLQVTATPDATFALAAGSSLPAGLSLSSDGVVTGTPEGTGVEHFDVTATNDVGSTTETITVDIGSVPEITTTALPPAEVSKPYSFTIEAEGVPDATFDLIGALPATLTFNETTGEISGTPNTEQEVALEVKALNDRGSASKIFTLIIGTPPEFETTELPFATKDVEYGFAPLVSGFPAARVRLSGGSLPLGMVLDTSTGKLSGIAAESGSFDIELTATNELGSASREYTLEVNVEPAITAIDAPRGVLGQPYDGRVWLTGRPDPTLSFEASGAPAGLVFDASSGQISGTPMSVGSFDIGLEASNVAGNALDTVALEVDMLPSFETSSLPGARVGSAYSATIKTVGRPAPQLAEKPGSHWPDGLVIDEETGKITGTPHRAGTYRFTLVADNIPAGVEREFVLEVR